MSDPLLEIGKELDQEAYQNMLNTRPGLVGAIETAVGNGKSAREVGAYVLNQTGRNDFAKFAMQVARHVIRLRVDYG